MRLFTHLPRGVFAACLALGCGGQLLDPGATAAGSGGANTGNGGGAGMVGAGGTGAVPPPVDMCVLTSMKVCQNSGCHGGTILAAGLSLENNVLTRDYGKLVDAPNRGEAPAGCMAGQFKLIDSSNAANSLIYTKLSDLGSNPPCAMRMPIIGNFSPSDKACVLSWINSVLVASGFAPRGGG